MSERDELVDEIAGHPIGSGYYSTNMGIDEAREIADAILAAGYRRPRTITTVEELKALRLPAIIDSPAGGPARVEYYAGPGKQQRYVEPLFCDDDSDTECYSPEFFASFGLPATVLHEPEATK